MTRAEIREQLKSILEVAVPTNYVAPSDEAIDPLIDEFIESLAQYAGQDPRMRR